MSNEFKFKKGDKILGQNYEILGMYKGEVYTVRSCTETSMTLEECFDGVTGYHYKFTPSSYEISTNRDYLEMTPNYDKQQQQKDELKTIIASKMQEVDALVKQLNQLNQM